MILSTFYVLPTYLIMITLLETGLGLYCTKNASCYGVNIYFDSTDYNPKLCIIKLTSL